MKYDSIIGLSRPDSGKRIPMSMAARAAQFAPFAALTELEGEIQETARKTAAEYLSRDKSFIRHNIR